MTYGHVPGSVAKKISTHLLGGGKIDERCFPFIRALLRPIYWTPPQPEAPEAEPGPVEARPVIDDGTCHQCGDLLDRDPHAAGVIGESRWLCRICRGRDLASVAFAEVPASNFG